MNYRRKPVSEELHEEIHLISETETQVLLETMVAYGKKEKSDEDWEIIGLIGLMIENRCPSLPDQIRFN